MVLVGGMLGAALGGFYYAANAISPPEILNPVTFGSCFEGTGASASDSSQECKTGRLIGAGLVGSFALMGVLAIATGLGAYLASFVDAALFGQREEELSFETIK